MKVSDILIGAQRRFLKYDGFTKGTLARDANNDPVMPRAPSACQWCMLGALHSAPSDMYSNRGFTLPSVVGAMEILEQIIKQTSGATFQTIASLNDHPGFKQRHAINLFNLAIRDALNMEANDNVFRCFYSDKYINEAEHAINLYRNDTAWWKAHCGDMIGFTAAHELFPIPSSLTDFDGMLYP